MALQWLAKIFGTNPIEAIGNIADKFIQTKEEKAQFQKEMEQLLQNAEINAQNTVTERHKHDMQSDSWLSKNIRPSVFIYSLIMITLGMLFDGNIGGFEIKESYVDLMELITGAAVTFYFLGRSAEKITKIVKNGNIRK